MENIRLPEAAAKCEAYAVQVDTDSFLPLDALDRPGTPEELPALPAVVVLRRVWARHYERITPDAGGKGRNGTPGTRLRTLQARDPNDPVESPYDPDAQYRTRSGRTWAGYVVHLTETCDEDAPRLVVQADTTDASVHEAMRVASIHSALAAKDLTPAQHLADAAYMSADLLLDARERRGIDLIGPQHRGMSWQGTVSDAFNIADFAVDWHRQMARCPDGKESMAWASHGNSQRPHRCTLVQVRFHPNDCRACPSRPRCTRSAPTRGRDMTLHPRREHEVLVAARAREHTTEYRKLYAQRQGIECTMSQGIRAFGLRRHTAVARPRPGCSTSLPPRHQPWPDDGVACWAPAGTHPHFPFRKHPSVTGHFANSVHANCKNWAEVEMFCYPLSADRGSADRQNQREACD